ncbi:MAG: primosomal protein N' [Robiginitalea sp.]
MDHFVEVLLPIPLERNFTYAVTSEQTTNLVPGMRVAVPFGKSKLYTGIVISLHNEPPVAYEAKGVYQVLDDAPLVTERQLKHWKWMASYYMCTLGEVFRTAVPGVFLLESETRVLRDPGFEAAGHELNEVESLILEALENQTELKVRQLGEVIDRKHVLPILNRMLRKKAIRLQESLGEDYRPKTARFLRIHPRYQDEKALEELLESLTRAPKQTQVLLHLFQLRQGQQKPVRSRELEQRAGTSRSVIRALLDKEILQEYDLRQDRIVYEGGAENKELASLNPEQKQALTDIRSSFESGRTVLLHGVTASGKTEVYSHLIREYTGRGKQVLYLVPEIALTAQLIHRLQSLFGSRVAAFHSRQNQQERGEIWHYTRAGVQKASVILGARSSLFLPFSDLGLIIIDEEHENSYKQFDPAPRYHGRDAAIMLGTLSGANVLLGSATPSIESFFNTQKGKYDLVTMKHRYGGVLLPEIELVNLADAYRRKKMKGHFSARLQEAITDQLKAGRQVILFQNRRGFSPIVECMSCGHVPGCPNCDVSLTYHQKRGQLRCHYCGYHRLLETQCQACGNATLDTKGFGTEQVEEELGDLFPEVKIARMDLDTTRGKHSHARIIEGFEAREVDVLVGTQMVTKGLDFGNVGLVGIMNADTLLNFPHFRAHERCYQLLTQVAGRAGRKDFRGLVLVQSFNPYHQILKQVSTGDYPGMYQEQLYEREQFRYPPLVRLIKITLRHREWNRVEEGATWFARSMRMVFGKHVLGPEYPPVARIRNQYHKQILLKIPAGQSLPQTKNSIKRIEQSFNAISQYRSIRLIYNVDYI